jgi:excisionase family DNA binding protein
MLSGGIVMSQRSFQRRTEDVAAGPVKQTVHQQHDLSSRLAVSVEEGARMLGVGRATLYRLVLRGEIDSFTIGRARRIAVATLEQYVGIRRGA